MSRTARVSAGLDQTLTPKARVSTIYSYVRGSRLFRGHNRNAPVDGVRPDPSLANLIEVVSDARSRLHQLRANLDLNLTPPAPSTGETRWNWRRTTLHGGYTWSKADNNADGPFSVPATGDLAGEWGPSPGDRRHRLYVSVGTRALRNLSAYLTWAASSGAPYSVTTGLDDNADVIFNDRPAGMSRNSQRTAGQSSMSGTFSYTIPKDRYRLSFNVSVTNLTNRPNYTGYSGVRTSPFFMTPTAVSNPRKVDVSLGVSF